ncbi:hypothetical protein, partial [Micromonospora lupini]|uniref:hypothetical protein n=1 Tax=Micromonospora lupini TaxID=285679 RepID=UPI0031D9E248
VRAGRTVLGRRRGAGRGCRSARTGYARAMTVLARRRPAARPRPARPGPLRPGGPVPRPAARPGAR